MNRLTWIFTVCPLVFEEFSMIWLRRSFFVLFYFFLLIFFFFFFEHFAGFFLTVYSLTCIKQAPKDKQNLHA